MKLLMREGAYQIISEKFYRAVVQAVLLFGSETWVLTAVMMKNIKGIHVGLLWKVTGKKARRMGKRIGGRRERTVCCRRRE